MGTTIPTGGEGFSLGDIAKLIPALQSLFLGSGKTTDNSSQSQTGTGATVNNLIGNQASSIDPGVFQSLLTQMSTAFGNSQDFSKLQPIIDSILQQSKEAFAPQLGNAATAGLYNSSTLGNLAGVQSRNAANLIFQALTQYSTNQQQVAAGLGNTLAGATKSVATTQAQAGNTTDTKATTGTDIRQTQPVINIGGNNLPLTLGIGALGLGAKGLFSDTGKKFLGDLFGSGGGEAGADSAISTPAAIDSFSASPGSIGGLQDAIGAPSGVLGNSSIVSEANEGLLNFSDSVGGLGLAAANPNSFSDFLPSTDISGLGNFFPSSGALDLSGAGGLTAPSLSDLTSPAVNTGFSSGGALDVPDLGDFTGSGLPGVADESSDFFPELGIFSATSSPSDAAAEGSTGLFGKLSDLVSSFNPVNVAAGAAGGLLGGFINSEIGGNPVGGAIGSTLGGVAAAATGFLGPVGLFLGPLLGSFGGGLFGQHHPESKYSSTQLEVNPDYTLKLGDTVSQLSPNDQQYRDVWQKQLDALNTYIKSENLKIANPLSGNDNKILVGPVGNPLSGYASLGFDNPNEGDAQRTTYSDVSKVFQDLQFSSDNPDINSLVAGRSFIDPNQLQSVLSGGAYTASPDLLDFDPSTPTPAYLNYLQSVGIADPQGFLDDRANAAAEEAAASQQEAANEAFNANFTPGPQGTG